MERLNEADKLRRWQIFHIEPNSGSPNASSEREIILWGPKFLVAGCVRQSMLKAVPPINVMSDGTQSDLTIFSLFESARGYLQFQHNLGLEGVIVFSEMSGEFLSARRLTFWSEHLPWMRNLAANSCNSEGLLMSKGCGEGLLSLWAPFLSLPEPLLAALIPKYDLRRQQMVFVAFARDRRAVSSLPLHQWRNVGMCVESGSPWTECPHACYTQATFRIPIHKSYVGNGVHESVLQSQGLCRVSKKLQVCVFGDFSKSCQANNKFIFFEKSSHSKYFLRMPTDCNYVKAQLRVIRTELRRIYI